VGAMTLHWRRREGAIREEREMPASVFRSGHQDRARTMAGRAARSQAEFARERKLSLAELAEFGEEAPAGSRLNASWALHTPVARRRY
jgi:hypothetical protein